MRASGDSPVSLAMTHMRWLHGQSGHESTGYTRSVVQCVGGLRAWPIDICSNEDAGRSQSETPTPCECEQARRQILIRQDFHCGSSRVLATKHFGKVNGKKKLQHTTKPNKNQDTARTKQTIHNVCVHLPVDVCRSMNEPSWMVTNVPWSFLHLCSMRRATCCVSLLSFLSHGGISCQCFTC